MIIKQFKTFKGLSKSLYKSILYTVGCTTLFTAISCSEVNQKNSHVKQENLSHSAQDLCPNQAEGQCIQPNISWFQPRRMDGHTFWRNRRYNPDILEYRWRVWWVSLSLQHCIQYCWSNVNARRFWWRRRFGYPRFQISLRKLSLNRWVKSHTESQNHRMEKLHFRCSI